ncbi:MAG: hypothetical protein IPG50_34120 [Myxococcales bacterium]|nr:hypothetical protein [Myxococcales bacterium]
MKRTSVLASAIAAVLSSVTAVPGARADGPRDARKNDSAAECVAAFDRAQDLAGRRKLTEARELYLTCARESCHTLVRRDCADRLERLERDQPTLIFGARDRDGRDLANVRVTVDGAPLDGQKLALGVPLDPGEHEVWFELPPYAAKLETVVARVGEKNRAIVVTLERASAPSSSGAKTEADPPPSKALPLGLAAASAAAALGFAAFGVAGFAEKNELLDRCAAACSAREVAVVRNRYIAADVLLGVALLTGAAAAYLSLRPEPPRPVVRARLPRLSEL